MYMPPKPDPRDAEPLPHKRSLLNLVVASVSTYGAEAASVRAAAFTPAIKRPDLRSRHVRRSYRLGAWGDPL